jgi:redox-sensitive bicupin YhaK (pirin superfamily)
MVTIRKSGERGHFDFGWLDTNHTFSFGEYADSKHMGFRSLRVINEDVVAPGKGFGEHPHQDMEIITYVLEGSLAHRDSLGHVQTLTPGEVQRMSAGTGIEHAEFNASKTEPVHLLQIWIRPSKRGLAPSYEQTRFPEEERRGKLRLVASPDGAEGSVKINQDAKLYATLLGAGEKVELPLGAERHAWVQVARGSVVVNGEKLGQGVGAAVSEEAKLVIEGASEAEFLVFDLA